MFFLMQGKPVVISPEDERMHVDLFQSNGFSGFASDKVTFLLVGGSYLAKKGSYVSTVIIGESERYQCTCSFGGET
jgi:hypothetical protein